jgi:O-antigen/teichoic acid export membrane protein
LDRDLNMPDAVNAKPPQVSKARGVVRNFLSVSTANLVNRVISFFVVAYAARVLGPRAYGQLTWAQAVYLYGACLADLGLWTLGVRTLAQERENVQLHVSNYVSLRMLTASAAAVLLAAFALVSGQSETTKWLVILYGLSLLVTGLLIDWVFTGLERMEFVGSAKILSQVTHAGLVIALVRGQREILFFPLFTFVGLSASAIFLMFVLRRLYPSFRFRPEPDVWSRLLREALPLGVSGLVVQVYILLPTLIVGWMKGDAATGYYGGAFRIVQVVQQLLSLAVVTLYPVVASRWKHAPEVMEGLLERILKIFLALGVPIAMGALVVGSQTVILILGDRFSSSVLPFQIMVWNVVIVGISSVYSQLVLLMNGKHREFLKVVVCGAVVSVILDLLLIPQFSHVGAAIAWLLAEIVMCIVSYRLARPSATIHVWRHLLKPLGAATMMALLVRLLTGYGMSIWFSIPLGAAVYGAVLIAIGGLDGQDLDFIKRTLRPGTTSS